MLRNKFWILFSLSLFSQDFSYSGYTKSMMFYSDGNSLTESKTDYEFNATYNARLNLEYTFSDNIAFVLENKLFGISGQSSNGAFYDFVPLTLLDYFDWNTNIYHDENGYLEHRIDRLYGTFWFDDLEVTIGRQRISWGKNFVWNPTDVFHPTSPTDFDNEEKNGADAIYAKYFLSELSSVEVATKFVDLNDSKTIAAKLNSNLFDYDMSILYGRRTENVIPDFKFFGISWSGDLFDAGFRGEIVHIKQEPYSIDVPSGEFGSLERFRFREDAFISAFSIDYTFENSLYIHTEFMMNTHIFERYLLYYKAPFSLQLEGETNESIFQEISYQFHPLIRGGYFFIHVPDAESTIHYINLNYSFTETIDMSFFALIGSQNLVSTEDQHAYYFRLKWYF